MGATEEFEIPRLHHIPARNDITFRAKHAYPCSFDFPTPLSLTQGR